MSDSSDNITQIDITEDIMSEFFLRVPQIMINNISFMGNEHEFLIANMSCCKQTLLDIARDKIVNKYGITDPVKLNQYELMISESLDQILREILEENKNKE